MRRHRAAGYALLAGLTLGLAAYHVALMLSGRVAVPRDLYDVAESLGVSLTRGIPVVVFFDSGGEVIGTTNSGELEPSRHYSSQQILKSVRDVVERHRVTAPDSVQ